MQRLECEPLLVLMTLAHIADVDHHPGPGRVVETIGDPRPDMMPAAVGVLEPSFDIEREAVSSGDTPVPNLANRRQVVRGPDVGEPRGGETLHVEIRAE